MKLLSLLSEKKALKGICSDNDKVSSQLLGVLREEHFHSGACKEAFKRVLNVVRKKGEVPDFGDLCTDPALSENTRKVLTQELNNKKSKIPKDKPAAKQLIQTLDQYRKMRGLYFNAKEVLEKLDGDKVDVDEMIDSSADIITGLRSSAGTTAKVYHYGVGNNMDKLIKRILYGEQAAFVPTGYRAWDDVNGGILRGSFMVMSATTGGGKSTVANQTLMNMAERGNRVCLVALEMTSDQTMMRTLAAASGIEVNKLAQQKLSEGEKKKIEKIYKKGRGRLKEIDARYSIFSPEEDMSLEEILFTLKPHNFDVICIDYISLLKGVDADENSVKQLGAISRAGKIWANNTNTILIMLAQLSEDGKIKYARSIAENADVAWLWVYTDESRETGIIDVRTTKSRNLTPINFQLLTDYSIMKVTDLEDSEGHRDPRAPEPTKKGDKRRAELDKLTEEINLPEDDDDD